MASIQKRGGRWVAEVRIRGQYASKSFGTRAGAKEWALDKEIALGRVKGVVGGKTLGDAFARYMEEVSPQKQGARWEVVRLKKLMRDDIARVALAKLSRNDFDNLKKRQMAAKLKASTINRELNIISSVLTTCRAWQWLSGNPLEGFQRPKDPPHRDKVFSPEQEQRILEALGYVEGQDVSTQRQRIAVAFLFSLETFMRQGETFGLEWERVFFSERYVLLPRTKNGDARKIPLSDRAIKLLKSLKPEQGRVFKMPQASAAKIFSRCLEMAGIAGYTWHDARHTGITRFVLRNKKMDMLTLAKIVGHRDPRNLSIYFNPSMGQLADMLNES